MCNLEEDRIRFMQGVVVLTDWLSLFLKKIADQSVSTRGPLIRSGTDDHVGELLNGLHYQRR